MPPATLFAAVYGKFQVGMDKHLVLRGTEGFMFGFEAALAVAAEGELEWLVWRCVVFSWHRDGDYSSV